MAKVVAALMIAICALIIFSSCGQASLVTTTTPQNPLPTAGHSPLATTVISEQTLLPGDVLAGLPVYPGATTAINPEFDVPSASIFQPVYAGPLRRLESQIASARYTVHATEDEILNWYQNKLAVQGYRKYLEDDHGGGETISGRDMAFFLPSQSQLNVEVHIYDVPGSPVFDLVVTYNVVLPKPPEEQLPDDVDSITATYFPGVLPTVKTLTDSQVIMQLVNMMNNLPVRPDYVCGGGPLSGGPQTIFSLVFHSVSKGDITVSAIIFFEETGIHVGDYPILEDTHGLLREAVERILGVQSAYPTYN